jgi:hypothetical protein
VFGREYLEFLELFPASDFAADLCAGFRDYRVVICASSFRKVIRRLDDLRARPGFSWPSAEGMGDCLLKLRGSMTAAIRMPLRSFDQVLGVILLPVSLST